MSNTGGGRFGEIYAQSRAGRPSLLEYAEAAGLTQRQRDAKAAQEEQLKRQDEQTKWQREQYASERQAEQQAQQAKAEQAKATSGAHKQRYWADMLAAQPQNADRIKQAAQAQGVEFGGTMVGPETMNQARATDVDIVDAVTPAQAAMDMQGRASGVLGPPDPAKTQRDPRSTFAQQLVDAGYAQGSERFNGEMARYNAAQLARMEREPKGMTINLGGASGEGAVGLVPPQQSKVQEDVITADKALAQLGRIDKSVRAAGGPAEMASLWERGKSALGSAVSTTPIGGSVDKEKLVRRRTAESNIATFRNAIFNKLSGAAVSEPEMDRLMQSVPDVGDSAADYTAKVATWKANLEFERQYGMDALVDGIRSGKLGGLDAKQPASKPGAVNPEHPVNKLIASGMTPEQAIEKYRQEQQGAQ